MSTSPFSLTCFAQRNLCSSSRTRPTTKTDRLIKPRAVTVEDLKLLREYSTSSSLQLERKQSFLKRREAIGVGFSLFLTTFLFPQPPEADAAEATTGQCALTRSPSGLAYCDKVVGFGPEALKGQLIKAHYVGKLDNGTVFDSSYNRGKPLTFRIGVGEVIKGWDEGILGGNGIPPMLTGGKRILSVPAELGYGMRGAGCRGGSCIIPPNSVLIFDVEFIGKA